MTGVQTCALPICDLSGVIVDGALKRLAAVRFPPLATGSVKISAMGKASRRKRERPASAERLAQPGMEGSSDRNDLPGVETDGLGDWRLRLATTLAADVPAAYPGGPSHKAGAPVYQSSMIATEEQSIIGFATPSAPALALDVALKASSRAASFREQLVFSEETVTPWGSGRDIPFGRVSTLYDYFEQCMMAITFSFLALECFCNETIDASFANGLTGPLKISRRDGEKIMAAEELERQLSTEEKLATVLPQILAKESPKGRKEWEGFIRLKEARDATVHLKSRDQYTRGAHLKDSSLFFHFLNRETVGYPRAAIAMIWHFRPSGATAPRWLEHLMRIAFPERRI